MLSNNKLLLIFIIWGISLRYYHKSWSTHLIWELCAFCSASALETSLWLKQKRLRVFYSGGLSSTHYSTLSWRPRRCYDELWHKRIDKDVWQKWHETEFLKSNGPFRNSGSGDWLLALTREQSWLIYGLYPLLLTLLLHQHHQNAPFNGLPVINIAPVCCVWISNDPWANWNSQL